MGFFNSFQKKEGKFPISDMLPPPPEAPISPPIASLPPPPVNTAPVATPPEKPASVMPPPPPLYQGNEAVSAPMNTEIEEAKKEFTSQSEYQPPNEYFKEQLPPSFPTYRERTYTSANWQEPREELPSLPKTEFSYIPDELPGMPQMPKPEYEPTFFTNKEDIPYFPDEDEAETEALPLMDMEPETTYYNARHRFQKTPLFIRTDHYTEILSYIDTMRNHVKKSFEKIYWLENLKKNSDAEHKKYKNALEDIQRKLIYVDKTVFGT